MQGIVKRADGGPKTGIDVSFYQLAQSLSGYVYLRVDAVLGVLWVHAWAQLCHIHPLVHQVPAVLSALWALELQRDLCTGAESGGAGHVGHVPCPAPAGAGRQRLQKKAGLAIGGGGGALEFGQTGAM